jgi:hypothetical protein
MLSLGGAPNCADNHRHQQRLFSDSNESAGTRPTASIHRIIPRSESAKIADTDKTKGLSTYIFDPMELIVGYMDYSLWSVDSVVSSLYFVEVPITIMHYPIFVRTCRLTVLI